MVDSKTSAAVIEVQGRVSPGLLVTSESPTHGSPGKLSEIRDTRMVCAVGAYFRLGVAFSLCLLRAARLFSA